MKQPLARYNRPRSLAVTYTALPALSHGGAVLLLAGFVLAAAGCSGHSTPASTALGSDLVVSCGGMIYSGTDLLNAKPSITRCELLFDGKVIATINSASPQVSAEPFGVAQFVERGHHTMAFRISGQKSSPTTYTTTVVLVLTDENSIYQLPDKVRDLYTGEAIEYELEL